MQIIGLLLWKKHQAKNQDISDVVISLLDKKTKIIWGISIVAAVILFGNVLQKMGGAQPYVDATTTILQITAHFFMIKRLVEQWITWMIVDVVSIWMWLTAFLTSGNDVTVLIMWVAYLFNAIYGYYNWKKIYIRQEEHAA